MQPSTHDNIYGKYDIIFRKHELESCGSSFKVMKKKLHIQLARCNLVVLGSSTSIVFLSTLVRVTPPTFVCFILKLLRIFSIKIVSETNPLWCLLFRICVFEYFNYLVFLEFVRLILIKAVVFMVCLQTLLFRKLFWENKATVRAPPSNYWEHTLPTSSELKC